MECLGIPVDHRLRSLIRETRPIGISKAQSGHVQILSEFGESLQYEDGEPIDIRELNFTLDLAGPDTKGGILVLLLQPLATSTYQKGFIADVDDSATLKAIRQLSSLASNQLSGLDNISVFDLSPFLPQKYEDNDTFEDAHNVLVRMVEAKAPDVVICCGRSETRNSFVKDLKRLGVGQSFSSPKLQIGTSTFLRVNAFHPSYSVNYNPSYSCFRRLLILEFVKAFRLQQNQCTEDDWMESLRFECKTRAYRIYVEEELSIPTRWAEILDTLRNFLRKTNFFQLSPTNPTLSLQESLTSSGFSWICCDAGLLLNNIIEKPIEDSDNSDVEQQTQSAVRQWCLGMWTNLQSNAKPGYGIFDHHEILLEKSQLDEPFATHVQNILIRFLRDMNLSFYRHELSPYRQDRKAQRDAFFRFSRSLEDALEVSQQETALDQLSQQFMQMGVQE